MDKKVLVGLINSIIAEVAAENGVKEESARTLVGIWIEKNWEFIKRGALAPFTVVVE